MKSTIQMACEAYKEIRSLESRPGGIPCSEQYDYDNLTDRLCKAKLMLMKKHGVSV